MIKHMTSLAWINFRRRIKENVLSIALLSLSLILATISLIVPYSLDAYLKRYIYQSLEYRSIVAGTFKYDLDSHARLLAMEDEHEAIEYIYYEPFSIAVGVEDEELKKIYSKEESLGVRGSILLKSYVEPRANTVIKGRKILPNETNVALVPNDFFPVAHSDSNLISDQPDIPNLKGEDVIGKSITIKYFARDFSTDELGVNKEFSYTFEIVGVYDSFINGEQRNNVYIPYEDILMFHEDLNSYNTGLSENYGKAFTVIVDDYRNVDKIIRYLSYKGFRSNRMRNLTDAPSIIKSISMGLLLVAMITVLVVSINLVAKAKRDIEKRKAELGMYKAMGYDNKALYSIMLLETSIISMLSLVIVGVITSVIVLMSNNFIQIKFSFSMRGLKVMFPQHAYIYLIVLGIVIPLVCNLFSLGKILIISPKCALDQGGTN